MVMKDQQKESLHYIHLSDYKKFDYSIPEIFIDFNIKNDHVKVITEYKFIKENPKSNSLISFTIEKSPFILFLIFRVRYS